MIIFDRVFPWIVALDPINYLVLGLTFLDGVKRLPEFLKQEFDQDNFTV